MNYEIWFKRSIHISSPLFTADKYLYYNLNVIKRLPNKLTKEINLSFDWSEINVHP